MCRKCSTLQINEQVVFNIYLDIFERKIPMVGSVIDVNMSTRKVCVSWLEGYKSRLNFIPYEDMLAVHNPNGELMNFGNISGRSDLLVSE